MANVVFSIKKKNKNINTATNKGNESKKIKVELIKHPAVNYEPEYYLYTNELGEISKYSGIVTKDLDGTYVGKIINTHKVILEYHPKLEAVEHVDEYFSYIDNNGNEKTFIGTPEFDIERNTYFGNVVEDILQDKVIEIFKEDK